MEPILAALERDYNSELRAAMGRFAREMDEASRMELLTMLAQENTRLLVPVCDVDHEKGDFQFTTTREAPGGWVLHIYTHDPARPTGDGAEEVLAVSLPQLMSELADTEIIGFVIEDSEEHSVVVYPHEGGYMLLGMWELDPHGFAQN